MVRTLDSYGAPSFGALGLPPAGLCLHTPENADPTVNSALATARWQASSGNTSNGSYHGILAHDSGHYADAIASCTDSSHWIMVRTVPWNKCVGGITTNRDPAIWRPDRYPWMESMLGKTALADPNKWLHQIAIGGKAAWYTQNGYPKGLVTALAEWVKILEDAYKYNAVLVLHRYFQTNRTDPGPETLPDLVIAEWNRLYNAPPPPPPAPKTYTQAELDAAVAAAVAPFNEQITTLKARIVAKDDHVAKYPKG